MKNDIQTKHTPGNWVCYGTRVYSDESREMLIADVGGNYLAETFANAQLIASLPDALKLLIAIHESFRCGSDRVYAAALAPSDNPDDETTLQQAIAAYISKATPSE